MGPRNFLSNPIKNYSHGLYINFNNKLLVGVEFKFIKLR